MAYPEIPNGEGILRQIVEYGRLKHEYGSKGVAAVLGRCERGLREALAEIKRLPVDESLAGAEPDELGAIRQLRPRGRRRMWEGLDGARYRDRLEGALLGRFAGCTLGAPVEFWSIERMRNLARENGQAFPPEEYWKRVPDPHVLRYGLSRREAYSQAGMKGVPVDDDLAYTLLGLLIVEEFGPEFDVEEVGRAWLKYLPMACTAEKVALAHLRDKVPAWKAAEKDNPYCQWIGADIRSDPWGYMAPGFPEKAAEMAYNDAYVSHRRNGLYGAMYFAAVIAAAFAVDDPVEALRMGLSEIPGQCGMAKAVRWALRTAGRIKDYEQARAAVERKFKGMSGVHTINNACLTIWGVTVAGRDLSRAIGETVAMGMDNDCTAATAGSIVGAVVGKKGVDRRWYARFDNTVHSYLIGKRRFTISGLVKRFERQARRVVVDGRMVKGENARED